MKTISDEAIILRRFPYGEKDIIFVLFTKYQGKKRVIAKGVRSITSRRGGHLDLFNIISLSMREGSGMDLITEATTLHTLSEVKNNKNLLYVGYYVAELLELMLSDEVVESHVFNETVRLLCEINKTKTYVGSQLRSYERYLLSNGGFWSDEIHGTSIPEGEVKRKEFFQSLIEEVADKRLKTKQWVD
ncbi:DNA repair protein RecO [candidate division WWE3 bacterium CG_4_9_14_3_um_filter_41_6]|uniref:DNA repair protein RecO n=1 Tax=candidate division WWE3 bacterium CG_4_10_14_0_2_um_filter_41_14 TaxID=1975072 RepID=A0A2M7THX7_UNCKA|nr:MAG: DNA repair protein RecO [candidate division WWE3 bacterium CG_4_10_14_0_2_um_filter_41_14]PJA38284.1 MAG: DNA repair protein RecO [candidate division WWE3 bacterium CG_4_9_14_3_um_filter_41_6]